MNWKILQILCINQTGLKKKINMFKQQDILGPPSLASETEDVSVLPPSRVCFQGQTACTLFRERILPLLPTLIKSFYASVVSVEAVTEPAWECKLSTFLGCFSKVMLIYEQVYIFAFIIIFSSIIIIQLETLIHKIIPLFSLCSDPKCVLKCVHSILKVIVNVNCLIEN